MSSAVATSGFFGKVPALGDFVQRALPSSFVTPWDEWLGASVAGSKSVLGDRWLEVYLQSPIWRFFLSDGVLGSASWAGVMMPSVDRVGRYFPLTIAAPVESLGGTFQLIRASAWFDAAQALALDALDEDSFDLATFEQAVADLGTVTENRPFARQDEYGGPGGWCYSLTSLSDLGDALDHMGSQFAQQALAGSTYWWSEGSELVAPSLLLCSGLPQSTNYAAMLDGRWTDADMAMFAVPEAPEAPAAPEEALL